MLAIINRDITSGSNFCTIKGYSTMAVNGNATNFSYVCTSAADHIVYSITMNTVGKFNLCRSKR